MNVGLEGFENGTPGATPGTFETDVLKSRGESTSAAAVAPRSIASSGDPLGRNEAAPPAPGVEGNVLSRASKTDAEDPDRETDADGFETSETYAD
jgi:hypothetical protein